jgi:hypothetical protein
MILRLSLLFTLALSSTAVAAPAKSSADADEAARKQTAQGAVREYDFENDFVDGESMHPDHTRIDARPLHGHKSLISIRPHFISQMIQMANDV